MLLRSECATSVLGTVSEGLIGNQPPRHWWPRRRLPILADFNRLYKAVKRGETCYVFANVA